MNSAIHQIFVKWIFDRHTCEKKYTATRMTLINAEFRGGRIYIDVYKLRREQKGLSFAKHIFLCIALDESDQCILICISPKFVFGLQLTMSPVLFRLMVWRLECAKKVQYPLPETMMSIVAYLYIDGLAQDCSNSNANALELLQSCTKPSICTCVTRPPCSLVGADIITSKPNDVYLCILDLGQHWFKSQVR